MSTEYKEAMALVLRQPAARAQYRRRAAIAERPYAEVRLRQGLLRFRRRGRAGAAVEFALHCLAFDLKWAVHHRSGRMWAIFVAFGAPSAAQRHWQLLWIRVALT